MSTVTDLLDRLQPGSRFEITEHTYVPGRVGQRFEVLSGKWSVHCRLLANADGSPPKPSDRGTQHYLSVPRAAKRVTWKDPDTATYEIEDRTGHTVTLHFIA